MKKRKVEIWFQEGNNLLSNRLRVLSANRISIFSCDEWDIPTQETTTCCWDEVYYNLKTLKEKREAMHRYDKMYKFNKAIKIGEFYE